MTQIDERELYLETEYWTGHIDRAIVKGETGAVIDYKQIEWGDHAHPADNPQIWVYVYLLSEHYSLKQCWGVIKQPGHPLAATLFDRQALDGLKEWAIQTSQKAIDHLSLFQAGEWCEHCRLRAVCPAGKKYLEKTNQLAEDEELPVGNPVVLGMLLDRFRILSWFEDAVKNLSRILLRQDPNSVQGWKLAKAREVTVIKDLDRAYEMAHRLGIPDSAWHKPNPGKLKTELEGCNVDREEIDQIIDVAIEPGYLVRMNKAERKALGL